MSGVSVIIPTLNAESEIGSLLESLDHQSVKPDEILVIDSSSADDTVKKASSYERVRVSVIPQAEFDHGGTRHKAFGMTSGEFVLFLTQDAFPTDEKYIENLLAPFSDDKVALVTGRQIPKRDARRFEQLVREFNYPANSNVRTEADIQCLGIKAFFASDVCSAYRRAAYQKVGGFPRPCKTNEDMLIAARFLRAGYKVAYASNACVYHSHSLTPAEQYRRNKAVGGFLAENAEELDVPSEVGEGGRLMRAVIAQLIQENNLREILRFMLDCWARFVGNRCGRLMSQYRNKEKE